MTDRTRVGSTSLAGARGLAALFLVGLTLRTPLTVIGPILTRIQEEVEIVHAAAGLLTGLPVACMGLAAFFTSRLLARVGTSTAVAAALMLVAVAGLVRAVAPGAIPIFVATMFIGIGIGVGGASAPVFVKERMGRRPAAATGVHVTGIILGSMVVASMAVPLAQGLGSWRWPLGLFSIVTLAAALGWLSMTRGADAPQASPARARRVPWRSPIAWLLVVVFSLQSLLFFGLATWLPAAYAERGWSEADAANLVAILILSGLPGSFAIGWLADRRGSRRRFLVVCAAGALISSIGFIVAPDLAVGWAVIGGVALGALFSLALTLPVDASAQPADVGPLTGMMLGVGYLFAASAPVVMGAVRDLLGTFTASLAFLGAGAAALLGVSMLVTSGRLALGRTAGVATDDRYIPVRGDGL